jgi:hypothetical protein
VAFTEGASVFLDPLARTYRDPDHSEGEQRFLTIGRSERGRTLIVAHRDLAEDRIRIISARKAQRNELYAYTEES